MGDGDQFRRPVVSRVLERLFVLLRGPKRKSLTRRRDPRLAEPLPPSHPEELTHLSSFVSLSIILFICLIYVAWGLLVYHTVGMKWPPPWSFGEVQDLPASSEYSTEVGNRFLSTGQPERLKTPLPQPQHVLKRPGSRPAQPSGGQP